MMLSQTLTVFEGPDGSGKSTAARWFAERTGARYVHFPALPQVTDGLARMYVEAMVPALLGYQPVVFDRCWLSEIPYGTVFRGGRSRMTNADIMMLERLAMRCGGVVIKCLPPVDTCVATYRSRKCEEMLEKEEQLVDVWSMYHGTISDLPMVGYDYTRMDKQFACTIAETQRMPRHPTHIASAGNWNAKTVLVGEGFAERKNQDPWYQWPFGSFSNSGCSRWLADELNSHHINERDLLWVNSDQDLSICRGKRVIAMGREAKVSLDVLDIPSVEVPHPQYWKRFKASGEMYPLLLELEAK